MALNLNKVILAGRITSAPELKTTTSGLNVTSFSIAVDRRTKEKSTDFINCVAWRGSAEFICKYFTKGSPICITGNIQMRKWQDKDGSNRYAMEVIVEEAHFVESKGETFEPVEEGSLPF